MCIGQTSIFNWTPRSIEHVFIAKAGQWQHIILSQILANKRSVVWLSEYCPLIGWHFYISWNAWNKWYLVENICCIASPLATKLLHIVLFHEDITQLKQKNYSRWYTRDLSLHWVSAMLVHYFYRYENFSVPHFHSWWSDFGLGEKRE